MTRVLLTHGYFLADDPHEQQVMKPYPPLGLLYLSAYLRREGVDVEVFDTTFRTREDLESRLAQAPGVVGVYANLMTRRSVVDVMRCAKRHGWTVVVGGPEPANYPEEYLAHGADVIVFGEGEETMVEVLAELDRVGAHGLHGVAGATFRSDSGTVVTNPDRPQIRDLDGLPWPDREQIDIPRYVDVWRAHHGAGSVNMITARGCPYRCRWCSHAVFGFTHRRRSAADCADELLFLRDRYQPDQVWYADDVFTIHHRWLYSYAAELDKRGVRMPFETISRADRMMKDEVLATLARMGCWRIWIGSESGSQRILDRMERGVRVDQVEWASRAAQRHGIQVGMFLMWGYEGETIDDVAETVELVKRAAPNVFLTTVAYPIRNTGYFHDVADRVRVEGDWAARTDRDHRVEGRYDPEYYRQADDWLRSAVEAHRLGDDDPQTADRLRRRVADARATMSALAGEAR